MIVGFQKYSNLSNRFLLFVNYLLMYNNIYFLMFSKNIKTCIHKVKIFTKNGVRFLSFLKMFFPITPATLVIFYTKTKKNLNINTFYVKIDVLVKTKLNDSI